MNFSFSYGQLKVMKGISTWLEQLTGEKKVAVFLPFLTDEDLAYKLPSRHEYHFFGRNLSAQKLLDTDLMLITRELDLKGIQFLVGFGLHHLSLMDQEVLAKRLLKLSGLEEVHWLIPDLSVAEVRRDLYWSDPASVRFYSRSGLEAIWRKYFTVEWVRGDGTNLGMKVTRGE